MLSSSLHPSHLSSSSHKTSSRHTRRAHRLRASAKSGLPPVGLFLEVDGCVIDIHSEGHRVSFNQAFTKLGYECTSWSCHVYSDLLERGDGTAAGLIKEYYGTVGWPMMMATSDRPRFIERVEETKREVLTSLLRTDQVRVRADLKQVLQSAISEGASIALLAGTQSEDGSLVVDSALRQLGPEIATHCRVFNVPRTRGEVEQEALRQGEEVEEPAPLSLSQSLAEAQLKLKRQGVAAVVSTINGIKMESAVPIGVDPTLLTSGSWRTVSPEWLVAVATFTGLSLADSMLVAASNSVMQAGVAAGMPVVAVPRKLALAGAYSNIKAKFEGYGPGLCTWPRLKRLTGLPRLPSN